MLDISKQRSVEFLQAGINVQKTALTQPVSVRSSGKICNSTGVQRGVAACQKKRNYSNGPKTPLSTALQNLFTSRKAADNASIFLQGKLNIVTASSHYPSNFLFPIPIFFQILWVVFNMQKVFILL